MSKLIQLPACLKSMQKARGPFSSHVPFPIIAMGLLTVTKQLALQLLGLNAWNRTSVISHSRRFGRVMDDQAFMPGGGMALVHVRKTKRLRATKGWALLDAQHRLGGFAYVHAPDYATQFNVTVYEVANDKEYLELFYMFDRLGRVRTLKDIVDIKSQETGGRAKHPIAWRTVVDALYKFKVEMNPENFGARPWDDVAKARLLDKYPDLSKKLFEVFYKNSPSMDSKMAAKLRRPLAVVAFLQVWTQSKCKARAENFFEHLLSDMAYDGSAGPLPRRCREMLARIDMARGGGGRTLKLGHYLGTQVDAYDTLMQFVCMFIRGGHRYNPQYPPYQDPKQALVRFWPSYARTGDVGLVEARGRVRRWEAFIDGVVDDKLPKTVSKARKTKVRV